MATNLRGIVTPEAVVLDFETAGIASPRHTRLIDGLIQGAALFALLIVGLAIPGSAGVVLAIVGAALVVVGYPTLCEALMRGRSPGKAALGLGSSRPTEPPSPPAMHSTGVRSGSSTSSSRPAGCVAVITALLSPAGAAPR